MFPTIFCHPNAHTFDTTFSQGIWIKVLDWWGLMNTSSHLLGHCICGGHPVSTLVCFFASCFHVFGVKFWPKKQFFTAALSQCIDWLDCIKAAGLQYNALSKRLKNPDISPLASELSRSEVIAGALEASGERMITTRFRVCWLFIQY